MQAKEKVDARINERKVVIFSKSFCPYCKKAKEVFKRYIGKEYLKANDYRVWEIENEGDCDKMLQYLNVKTKGRSVPRVFINGKFIGGGDDVVKKDKTGELVKLLQEKRQ